MKRIVGLFAIVVIASPMSGQVTERILLPVTPGIVSGAHGSEWRTEAVITNTSDDRLDVAGYLPDTCPGLCPKPPVLLPQESIVVLHTLKCETHGVYLFVEPGRVRDLAVSLRSRDLSRQHQTWGTSLPVVTAADFHDKTFSINDVPGEAQFRSALRVFNVDQSGGAVRLRFYAFDPSRTYPANPFKPDELLLELQPAFTVPQFGGGTASCPSSFEVALDRYPQLASAQRFRVEVTPLDERASYWAYVSVTHNETQHVTVLAPKND